MGQYMNWMAENESWPKVNPAIASVKPPEGQYSRTVADIAPPVTSTPPKPIVEDLLPPSRFLRKVQIPFDKQWGKRKSFGAMLRHQMEEEIIFCGACEKEHANHVSHC